MNRLVLGIIVAACALLVPSGEVFAQTGNTAGVGGRPANPDPQNARSRSIFIYNMQPQSVKRDQLFISNGTDESQTVELFAVDGTIANNGSYTCKQNSEEKQGAGAWINLLQSTVSLESRQTALVDFTVTLPSTAEPGEHNACIAIQSKDQASATIGAIKLTTRQAVRVAITVPGDIHREVSINSFKVNDELVSKDGARKWEQLFSVSLKNTGNVSADTDLSVRLLDIFNREVYRNQGQYPVMSDQKLDLSYANYDRPFWGGWFTAEAKITYDKRAGVFGTNDTDQLEHKATEPVLVFLWPTWQAVAIVFGAVALLIGLFWLTRRRLAGAGKSGHRLWGAYTVKQGDTVSSLAVSHKVSQQKVRALNKLDDNHVLQAGEKIFLPRN